MILFLMTNHEKETETRKTKTLGKLKINNEIGTPNR